jgi:hypothetical protein
LAPLPAVLPLSASVSAASHWSPQLAHRLRDVFSVAPERLASHLEVEKAAEKLSVPQGWTSEIAICLSAVA